MSFLCYSVSNCQLDFHAVSSVLESECHGEPVRDFYQVPARLHHLSDQTHGVVGGSAAAPATPAPAAPVKGLKRRKYTFECGDGTSFSEEVERPSSVAVRGCM